MDRMQIEKTLREIISKRIPDVKQEAITPEVDLAILGADSLAFSWITADVEEAFEIVLRGSDVMKLKTLSSSIDYVEKKIAK